MREEGRREEREILIFFFLCLFLYQIYENWTAGFGRG